MKRFATYAAICLTLGTFSCGPAADSDDAPIIIIGNNADVPAGEESEEVVEQEATEDQEQPVQEEPVEEEPQPVEPQLEERTEQVQFWTEGLTCASACGDRDWQCDVNPERQGRATFTKTNDDGSFTTRDTMVIESCDQEIPEWFTEYEYYTPDHQFEQASCPCLAPVITKIEIEPAALVSCDDACAAVELECQPETAWTLGQESGGEAVYEASDGTRYHPVGCGSVPPMEVYRGGRTYVLTSLHCGCQ